MGPNGCGKSTLIKMMAGLLEPDSGSVEIGETVKIGYLAQEEPDMDTNQRVIDYIKDIGEYVQTKEGRISASQMLERFLFTPDMQYTPIAKLSGGERRRLYLLSVLMGGVNALILDEPSNNVDIPTLAVFEDYLNSFVGIVITVSHDRYFLDNVVDRIFEFDGNGGLVQYEGGYTDYVEAKTRKYGSDSRIMNRAGSGEKVSGSKVSVLKASDGFKADTDGSESFKSWKQNRQARLKFTYKEQKEFETIDDEIAALEAKLSAIETDMLANATNSGKLNDLMKEKDETQVLLDEKMDRWVYLNDLAEQIEAQNKK